MMIVESSSSSFFPFNTPSDTILPYCDDCYENTKTLSTPIKFFQRYYTTSFVASNGLLSFNEGVYEPSSDAFPVPGYPVIAPFWSDVNTIGIVENGDAGTIYYRVEEGVTTAGTNLDLLLSSNFGVSFTSKLRIVVTWDMVGYYQLSGLAGVDKLNTYQLVVSTNGTSSYACFFYADNGINWTTGDSDGGVDGLGGTPANVGFNLGDSIHYYSYPTSQTADILNIDNVVTTFGKGNICFDIGNENIITTCFKNSDCNNENECLVGTCTSSLCSYSVNTENCKCMDSDVDGVNDCVDECPHDIHKIVPGICGCGVSDNDNDCDTIPECNDVCHGVDDRVDYNHDSNLDCLSPPLSFDDVYPPWKCNKNSVYVCNKLSTNSKCVKFDDVTSLMNESTYFFGKCYSACRSSYP